MCECNSCEFLYLAFREKWVYQTHRGKLSRYEDDIPTTNSVDKWTRFFFFSFKLRIQFLKRTLISFSLTRNRYISKVYRFWYKSKTCCWSVSLSWYYRIIWESRHSLLQRFHSSCFHFSFTHPSLSNPFWSSLYRLAHLPRLLKCLLTHMDQPLVINGAVYGIEMLCDRCIKIRKFSSLKHFIGNSFHLIKDQLINDISNIHLWLDVHS